MLPVTQLTPGAATQALQNDGITALGLTIPQLSPVWSEFANQFSFSSSELTLDSGGNTTLLVPFLGILETIATDSPRDVFDVSGDTVPGVIVRIRLHPQAAARLRTIAANRYGDGSEPFVDSVATQMVVRNLTVTPNNALDPFGDPQSPQWWEPGDALDIGGVVSFHDGRGLVVDATAVAAMYADLVGAFPALLALSDNAPNQGGVGADGGLNEISLLTTAGTTVHVVTPHGAAFAPIVSDRSIRSVGGATDGTLNGGLIEIQDGQSLQATVADDNADAVNEDDDPDNDDLIGSRLLWGWSQQGQLARNPLTPPPLAETGAPALVRRFIRLTAVDLPWHLLGNRSGADAPIADIPPDDGTIVPFHQPRVRKDVTVEYLSDGIAVMSHCVQVLSRTAPVGANSMVLLVSPTVQTGLAVPAAADQSGRWPQFPVVNGAAGMAVGAMAGVTADWFGADAEAPDMVVTIPAGIVPDGAHVRVYPQQFVVIESIGSAPSFLRGDGGSAIGAAGLATAIFLPNPLQLLEGQPRPAAAMLRFDIVITPRGAQRQLFGNNTVVVGDVAQSTPPDSFTPGGQTIIDALLAPGAGWFVGIAQEPLFGLDHPPIDINLPANPSPADVIELIRSLSSETTPRDGPRLPTQGRHETVAVSGIADGGANGVLSWSAVVSGGRIAADSLSTLHRSGNPGHPAGPDTHVAGVRVSGDLALDAARHSARRVQPIVPLPTGTPPGVTPGSMVLQAGNNFNEPSVADAGASTSPDGAAGAFLKTVAAFTETPELAATQFDLPDDEITFQDAVVGSIMTAMGLTPQDDIFTVGNEDRLTNEMVREFYHARHGVRDTLWSLRRSLGQARELVYIESPQLARTARPTGSPADHEIDLIEVLANRMTEQPSLRVIVCVPREGDFDPHFGNWTRHTLAARNEALDMLQQDHPERVVAFHPLGFPGRHAKVRSTTVIVDDCWALVGSSHIRRRGMTFDGAADIVSVPYALSDGYAVRLQEFRRELMLRKLGMDPADPTVASGAEWVRLTGLRSSFQLIADLLAQDGAGLISAVWPGPDDMTDTPEDHAATADPDGADGTSIATAVANLLASLGSD